MKYMFTVDITYVTQYVEVNVCTIETKKAIRIRYSVGCFFRMRTQVREVVKQLCL